jgi:ribosomal protein S27E
MSKKRVEIKRYWKRSIPKTYFFETKCPECENLFHGMMRNVRLKPVYCAYCVGLRAKFRNCYGRICRCVKEK